jgi:hypothetical protein
MGEIKNKAGANKIYLTNIENPAALKAPLLE